MAAKRVAVGMSGGVDSSVAAWLLQRQGYEVTGITMLTWQDGDGSLRQSDGCCGLPAAEDAARVAGLLGIPIMWWILLRNSVKKSSIILPASISMAGRRIPASPATGM